MRRLRDVIAWSAPFDERPDAYLAARARNAVREVRIGVGGVGDGVPARVLGFALRATDVIRADLPTLAGPATRVVIVSSRPKLALLGMQHLGSARRDAIPSLAALAAAIKLAGTACEIQVEEALATLEIPAAVADAARWSTALEMWMASADARNGAGGVGRAYATEHAAETMFRDVVGGPAERPALIVTLGGKSEARFLAVRRHVRGAARVAGLAVSNAIGLIMHSLAVPWYHETASEPDLRELISDEPGAVGGRLDRATKPPHGNVGLQSEARAARQMLKLPGAIEIARAIETPETAARFLRTGGFRIGERLDATLTEVLK